MRTDYRKELPTPLGLLPHMLTTVMQTGILFKGGVLLERAPC